MKESSLNRISIIIPTLNEAACIGDLLKKCVDEFQPYELIVTDGGSADNTVEIAKQFALVYQTSKGRGQQLNFGAQKSTGDILWFLHADTLPHPRSASEIQTLLKDEKIIGGAFEYNLTSKNIWLRFFSHYSNFKNKLFNRVYGDMGIFIRRNVFKKMNGFKESMLMEDYAFGRELKKHGKIKILPLKIETSPRDWYKEGFIRKICKDTIIKFAYKYKIENQKLYNWYYGVKK
ncbi:MAG: glycosyltransferase [Calditrichaeota bacterium]|nr:MAG: glycosyltransferase [Calditrichota bacterium]